MPSDSYESAAEAKKQKHGDEFLIPLLGRGVPAMSTDDGEPTQTVKVYGVQS